MFRFMLKGELTKCKLPTRWVFMLGMFCLSCGGQQNSGENPQATDQVPVREIALQYLEQNELDKAEVAFRKVIQVNPDDPMGYANLGLVLLQQSHYEEAEEQLKKALNLDADNPEINLIMAQVYHEQDEWEKATRLLEQITTKHPDNVKAYYLLARQYASDGGHPSRVQQIELLQEVIRLAGANIVPRMQLVELFAAENQADSCLAQLEEIKAIVPEFSKDVEQYYNQSTALLKQGKMDEARPPIKQFNQFITLTSAYIAGSNEIKGPIEKLTGYPVFTTDQFTSSVASEVPFMDIMQLTDATDATGLAVGAANHAVSSVLKLADYNGDGDIDIYYSFVESGAASSTYYLFDNAMGSFTDVKEAVGLNHKGKEQAADFVDYNNDGYTDLFITMAGGNVLYQNEGDGTFSDVTEEAGLAQDPGGNHVTFADLDQDGDLDLYIARNGGNKFYRNNGDGTFAEKAAQMGLTGNGLPTTDVDYGDIDNDGDLDLLVTNGSGNLELFNNHRYSQFEETGKASGLQNMGPVRASALGDYNNDGWLDLFVAAGPDGNYKLYQNLGSGTFSKSTGAKAVLEALKGIDGHEVSFFDFDNDGYQDLLIAGSTEITGLGGIHLLHNDSLGGFEDVSRLWPENIKQGFAFEIADFNGDGDQDIFLAGSQGIKLIRNDAGNMHHYIQVQLVGLSYGSSKNNRSGIGAQIALRAGDLYQMKTVTEPLVHFGLGNRKKADVMRIIWPNGVPQSIFEPKSKEDMVEGQILKGSCPFLFTWNGTTYEFQKDMMWRSALGMPLAIEGQDTIRAFANISKEYIKIPGEKLKPKDGKYSIKISEELWEAVYFDKAALVAVDHPASVDVFVDEKFELPPFPGRELYKTMEKYLPVSAVNGGGHAQLAEVSAYDFNYASDFVLGKYQGLAETHALILDLGDKAKNDDLYLFMRGWVFPTDASINVAMAQTEKYRQQPPYLQVKNVKGEWETVIQDLGFPLGKDKMVITDLTGKFLTADRKVRIVTNMQIYWDHIFFSKKDIEAPIKMHDLNMLSATLSYRGYSETYRKGGRYGPHWFDYDKVTKGQKWRDLTGDYTRYGDVLPLLREGDDKYIIANSGDVVTIDFDASLPELPSGWKRDFLIYSEGWVKDGDLNTAHGQTVKPLPFRGMKRYPYGDDVAYPTDREHQQYQEKYNTRKVGTEDFRNALKPQM